MKARLFLVFFASALIGVASAAGAQPVEPPPVSPPPAVSSASPEPLPTSALPIMATASPAAIVPSPQPSVIPSAPLPPAGVIPGVLSLEVTGSPSADGAFLDVQIRAALDRLIRPTLRFGASISYGPIAPWPLPALIAGSRSAVNVSVTVGGADDSALVTGVATVTLTNVPVAPVQPTILFLSDDPEYLRGEGLIFRGNVGVNRPVRLYYYESDLGLPRDVDVILTATVPSRAQLIASDSGPDRDVMSVGHAVTRDFLLYRRANEGSLVDIVPGVPLILRHGLLLQNELIAGAVDVQVLSGGPVTISVVASPAGGRPDAYLNGPRIPYDGHRRHGQFDLTDYGTIAKAYTVGGPPVAIQYGNRIMTPRNLDPSDDGRNFGDYGVARQITFTLDNPTDAAQHVYLYEKPLAGPVRSSFFVDGQLRELDCVRAAQPYTVMTYQLAAHTSGATTTVTMADGGSYYPLEFGVTDVQPTAYPPAYGAPDSCSPSVTAPSAAAAPSVTAAPSATASRSATAAPSMTAAPSAITAPSASTAASATAMPIATAAPESTSAPL